MSIWTKSLKKLKNEWTRDLIREKGEEWVERNREHLEGQWEYILYMGFVEEDPNLPIKELSATSMELEERGLMLGINGKYQPAEMGPIVRINPTHNTCMNAFMRGHAKYTEEMEKKEDK